MWDRDVCSGVQRKRPQSTLVFCTTGVCDMGVLGGLALPHGGRINIVKREDDYNWNDVFERERSRPKEMAQAAIGRRRYCL